ncbi:MAG: Stp1/IreP family PP2C-type Ser/Thr phosphatase [Limosilactobacillus sp.]|uniref:Stp1/IreP family PP2C-type Ser/Thr phosphatase n=1 Tax=Limosilactobacillus sp. TaxID=2773925 RepID=UPI0027062311|nr:Stp1/IreP family PP2C-type Ser/Thr phosphatase [Limosilactobacillus sp.]
MKVAYQTDVGQQRSDNQDRVAQFTNALGNQLFLIADGIGGNRGGDVAAETTVNRFGLRFTEAGPETPLEAIRWFAREAQLVNDEILKKSKENTQYHGMGTTLVAAMSFPDTLVVTNIGDSRGYLLHDGLMTQVTIDHSLVNELVKNGDITEEEALKMPQRNIITRAIGISSDAQVEVNRFKFESGDLLFMCSDGLSKTVDKESLKEVLTSDESVADKCSRLIKMANEAGGPDNITVLIGINDK